MTDLACADRTPLAGASAGSLIAACYHSGLSTETVTEACLVLADDCRVNGTRGRLGDVLSTFLHALLPDDAHERCAGKGWTALLSSSYLVRGCQHIVPSRELHGWRTIISGEVSGS